jgi:hypothetical protein
MQPSCLTEANIDCKKKKNQANPLSNQKNPRYAVNPPHRVHHRISQPTDQPTSTPRFEIFLFFQIGFSW